VALPPLAGVSVEADRVVESAAEATDPVSPLLVQAAASTVMANVVAIRLNMDSDAV
jgi:hypothetical protein